MDSKKQGAASASSFTVDLFGTKESTPTSSTGIFTSIFATPSKVSGMKSSSSEVVGSWQNHPSGNPGWNVRHGIPAMNEDAASNNIPNKEKTSIFQEERAEPCHLSSSLYYGGQDHYSQFPRNLSSGPYTTVSLLISIQTLCRAALSIIKRASISNVNVLSEFVSLRRKVEKMILTETVRKVLPEAIGGKVHFITRTSSSLGS